MANRVWTYSLYEAVLLGGRERGRQEKEGEGSNTDYYGFYGDSVLGNWTVFTMFLCRVRSTEGACKDVSAALIDICADIRVKSGK